jgi:molybdopterin-containing oxidoreductase family membrane subunit
MWFERFVITVTSLHRDAIPSSWDYFVPVTEVFFLVGTFGLFLTLFLLFVRFFPMIAISEVKGVMPQANPHWEGYTHHGGGTGVVAPMGGAPVPAAATVGGH